MAEFKSAERFYGSPLAGPEKRLLIWIARRLPRWVNSDHLTALGFVALVGVGVCYWQRWLVAASVLLVVNWFGDSLDGTLARVRDEQRPRYGFYIDHILDSAGSVFLFGGLAAAGYMSLGLALGVLSAYLLLSIESYLTTYTLGRFHMSFAAFGPTELRLLLIVGNFYTMYRSMVLFGERYYPLWDVGGACAIVGMTVALVVSAVRHGGQLYREETRR